MLGLQTRIFSDDFWVLQAELFLAISRILRLPNKKILKQNLHCGSKRYQGRESIRPQLTSCGFIRKVPLRIAISTLPGHNNEKPSCDWSALLHNWSTYDGSLPNWRVSIGEREFYPWICNFICLVSTRARARGRPHDKVNLNGRTSCLMDSQSVNVGEDRSLGGNGDL